MILFYQDYFFPIGHVDAGKPVPFGLRGQFGGRPHLLEQDGVEYKLVMLEFDLKGYSHAVRNGDDPLQEQLRNEHYMVPDTRTFEELYRIGLARIGLEVAPAPTRLLPAIVNGVQQVTAGVHKVNELVSAFQHLRQEHPQVYVVAQQAVSAAGLLFSSLK